MKIRAVTFDVGGTLIDPWPSVGHVYAEVARTHGFPAPSAEILDRQFASAWKHRAGFRYTKDDWARVVYASFAGSAADAESPAAKVGFFEALYARFTQPDVWRIYTDVLPTLTALRAAGLRLGIISNWDERLKPLLQVLHLSEYFHSMVISNDLGATKPDRRIFDAAAAQLAEAPDCILHVGDSPTEDVAGAKAAGFNAAWLDRADNSPQPDRIHSLQELIPGWVAV
ncbi:MAG: HAD-IA family hydrolase [Verrucomicrobiota bacterium]